MVAVERQVRILKAVAHPLRLSLVRLLEAQPRTVTELVEQVGAAQPAVSQQLGILRLNEVVAVERRGPFAYYRILRPRVLDLLRCLDQCAVEEEQQP